MIPLINYHSKYDYPGRKKIQYKELPKYDPPNMIEGKGLHAVRWATVTPNGKFSIVYTPDMICQISKWLQIGDGLYDCQSP